MFAFLSPRVLMLIGVVAALIAAFFAGIKVERGLNAQVVLEQKIKYEKEVADVRAKERQAQEQTVRALDDERKKSQELSAQIQQAMKDLDARRSSGIRVSCPKPAAARPQVVQVKTDTAVSRPVTPGAGTTAPTTQPGQIATGPSIDAGTEPVTPISATESQAEVGDETIDVSLDDPIFHSDFIGLYNAAVTRQPERLPEAPGGAHGGDSPAGPVSGRDIIGNLDENGKRFSECREKLKQWQNWARKFDLAK